MNASASGGEGIAVSIGPYGAVSVGFASMQPISFSVSIGLTATSGVFIYAGSASGMMATEPAGTSSSPGSSGNWRPATAADWTYTRLTVELTEPRPQRPFDNVSLQRYTRTGATVTGDVVDINPFFDPGRFTCLANGALNLTPHKRGELPLHLIRV